MLLQCYLLLLLILRLLLLFLLLLLVLLFINLYLHCPTLDRIIMGLALGLEQRRSRPTRCKGRQSSKSWGT